MGRETPIYFAILSITIKTKLDGFILGPIPLSLIAEDEGFILFNLGNSPFFR
jgi:hypothetical protein